MILLQGGNGTDFRAIQEGNIIKLIIKGCSEDGYLIREHPLHIHNN
jgi:hypothetical protein